MKYLLMECLSLASVIQVASKFAGKICTLQVHVNLCTMLTLPNMGIIFFHCEKLKVFTSKSRQCFETFSCTETQNKEKTKIRSKHNHLVVETPWFACVLKARNLLVMQHYMYIEFCNQLFLLHIVKNIQW